MSAVDRNRRRVPGRASRQSARVAPDATAAWLARRAAEQHLRHGAVARKMSPPGFSPTTLLHEAYIDMAPRTGLGFEDRLRFFVPAARAMRTLAIDRARERSAQKRGGGLDITPLDTQTAEDCAEPQTLSPIAEALDEQAVLDPELATGVDLKFFRGLTIAEIAVLQKRLRVHCAAALGEGEAAPVPEARSSMMRRSVDNRCADGFFPTA